MYLGVAQLVARYLGVVEAASSSLVTQIKKAGCPSGILLFFALAMSYAEFVQGARKRSPKTPVSRLDAVSECAKRTSLGGSNVLSLR